MCSAAAQPGVGCAAGAAGSGRDAAAGLCPALLMHAADAVLFSQLMLTSLLPCCVPASCRATPARSRAARCGAAAASRTSRKARVTRGAAPSARRSCPAVASRSDPRCALAPPRWLAGWLGASCRAAVSTAACWAPLPGRVLLRWSCPPAAHPLPSQTPTAWPAAPRLVHLHEQEGAQAGTVHGAALCGRRHAGVRRLRRHGHRVDQGAGGRAGRHGRRPLPEGAAHRQRAQREGAG